MHKVDFQKNNFFLINLGSFLELPCHVYLKSVKGYFLECNKIQATSFGCHHEKEVIGHSDKDFFSQEIAKCLTNNDKSIMHSNMPKIFMEKITVHNQPKLFLSYKMPFYNASQKLIGVFGTSINLNDNTFIPTFSLPLQGSKENKASSLSHRERECVRYLSHGLTAKQIARVLKLSPRTVEFYIENAKKKLVCHNRIELIAKAYILFQNT